jgi:hypothetical protein
VSRLANRYILLFETNRGTSSEAVELWQASSLTGPWSRITNGATRLPRAGTTGGTWSPYNFFYGPYMSEQLMKNGGQTIYYVGVERHPCLPAVQHGPVDLQRQSRHHVGLHALNAAGLLG